MRVLLADDDAALRHGLRAQLQKWGYEPIVCEDGIRAREVLLGGDPPPMAILDWSMPGADGVALCREIRESPTLNAMYVILLTAHDTRDAMVAGLSGGADEFVTKPFDWGVLQARIKIGARITTLQQTLSQRVEEPAPAVRAHPAPTRRSPRRVALGRARGRSTSAWVSRGSELENH